MARPPSPVNIDADSVKSGGVAALIKSLADFVQTVVVALAGQLTFKENFLAEIKELPRIDVPASWTTGGFPMLLPSKIRNPAGVLILRVTPRTVGALVPTVSVDWEPTETGIRLKALPGLSSGSSYSVTLLIVGG